MPAATTGDGGRIAYPKLGTGPVPILFLSDWLLSGYYWQAVMDQLPAEKYTLFMPDPRGTGLSFHPDSGFSLDRFAEDMVGLISQEAGFEKKWVLVGHGMGGMIAQRVATLYARKIAGLFLIAPFPMGGFQPAGALAQACEKVKGEPKAIVDFVAKLFAEPPDEDTREELLDDVGATSEAYVAGAREMWKAGGSTEKLAKIRGQTKVVAGGKDPLVPKALLETEVVARIPNATLAVYEGVGHVAPLEAYERLAQDIDAFASQLGG